MIDEHYSACTGDDPFATVTKCPDCGMTAYLMFFNRYVCPHCRTLAMTSQAAEALSKEVDIRRLP